MTYDQFIAEAAEVAQAYTRATGRQPAPANLYHNAWRRLKEGYSHAGVLWSIANHDQRPDPMPRDGGDVVPDTPAPRIFGGPLRVGGGGRQLVHDYGTFRPVFASALSILAPDKPMEAFLDWVLATGFNGLRVFAGEVGWANQTRERVRSQLPLLLEEAGARGLYVEVTALTDTRYWTTDEIRDHVMALAEICRGANNAILEIANEPYHGMQHERLHDPSYVEALGRSVGYAPWAVGASTSDEVDDTAGGSYVTVHLNRERERWNQIRRVRELEMLSGATGKFVMNNEPIGAAEVYQPGRRLNEPILFAGMGVLNRIFEVGGIFHFEDGLNCTLPVGPVQQEAADRFVEGSVRVIDTEAWLSFRNTGWADSPVRKAALDQTLIRAYSGITGDDGYTVLVGRTGDPQVEWQLGWHPVETLWDLGELQVLRIRRG